MDEEVFYDAEDEYRDAGTGASYGVHRAAFDNDAAKLAALLKQTPEEELGVLDLHGNNPLHIAALRGNVEAVQLLLDAGLSPAARSSRGWTPLDEALAAHAMPAARLLQRRMLADVKTEMKAKRAQLLATMRSMPDYSLQLKWQLGSSLPGLGLLLRRYAPHDTYTIWKVGDRLRVDGTLMGIDTKNLMPEWKRGHFSLIVDGSPAGVAAAAEASAAAVAAATAAAEARQKRRQQKLDAKMQLFQQHVRERETSAHLQQPEQLQQQQLEQQQPPPSQPLQPPPQQLGQPQFQQPVAAAGHCVASSESHGSNSSSTEQQPTAAAAAVEGSVADADADAAGSDSEFYDVDEQQQQQQKQLASSPSSENSNSSSSSNKDSSGGMSPSTPPDVTPAAAAGGSGSAAAPVGGGPRMLFLNHMKQSWVDLSADKKALKLEGRAEEDELEDELMMAMDRDVGKTRLKPRNFKFGPIRGWLGGNMTEKIEGWKCTVYEATGKLVAVNTSKARLHLSKDATFDDYLAAEYEADEVTETLIDPLNPSGFPSGESKHGSSGSRSGFQHRQDSSKKGGPAYGDEDLGLGSDSEYDAMMWNEASSPGGKSSSSSSKLFGKSSSSKASSSADTAGSGSSSSGRLLRARCWMAQEFPMKLAQLLPLLDVIGTANKHMAKVGNFLSKYTELDMFPVKLQVPLLLTVYVLVSFKAFHPLQHGTPHPPPAREFFEVPDTYKRKLLSEVMDKAAANMMGIGPRSGGKSEGGGAFYGGDEGDDFMFSGDDVLSMENDEELLRMSEAENIGNEVSASSSTSKGSARPVVRFGSGLDEDYNEYKRRGKW